MKKKVILITGASAGLGKQTAVKLCTQGHIVYGAARSTMKMAEIAMVGGRILYMDVTSEADVKSAIKCIIKEQGRIDILINCAAMDVYGFQEVSSIYKSRQMFDVNIWGTLRVIQAVLPHMRKQRSGKIINISTVISKSPFPFFGVFGASKNAMEALSDSLRQEVQSFGIQVANIRPTSFKTNIRKDIYSNLDSNILSQRAYLEHTQKYIHLLSNESKFAPDPSLVEKIILQIIKNPKIRSYYTVDSRGKVLNFVYNYLPLRFYDLLVNRATNYYHSKSRN